MSNTKGLKLLLTTRALGDGGAERTWVTIARRFAERGDTVVLAVDEGEPTYGFGESTNPRLMTLGRNHLVSTATLAWTLRRMRPDVAMAAISGSCVKLVAAAALARTKTPLVLSYHGFEEWKTGRLAAAAYYGMPIANRAADRIVAVSDGLRDRLIGEWGADPTKIIRIYNPVSLDLAAAAASAADLPGRPAQILAVGRLSPEKGMTDLVAAFARLDRPDARLAIAGDGPERERLVAQVAGLGLEGRVTFLGHCDPTPHYRTARLVVVPSRSEAFGLVLVEALAHGLPIVATACHGPVEILEAGRHGEIVPIADPDALAAAIGRALAAPGDPAARIARAATFSLEAGFAQWARLVDDIAGGGRRDAIG